MRAEFRDNLTNAIRYSEFKRIFYNLVLAAIVIVQFCLQWPASKALLQFNSILGLTILALLANLAYCAAYVVDVIAQFSGHKEIWRRYRWVLFMIGVVFAAMLTYFFSSDLSAWGYTNPKDQYHAVLPPITRQRANPDHGFGPGGNHAEERKLACLQARMHAVLYWSVRDQPA